MLSRLEPYARSRAVNVAVALVFVATNLVGYALGGAGFVREWGGSLAAIAATAFLVWKTLAYWIWMIVNAALWVVLLSDGGFPLLAWLQLSFLLFCAYGAIQWTLVRYRIGFDRPRLWGVFAATFVYQAINCVGWVQWSRDEGRLRARAAAAAVGTAA